MVGITIIGLHHWQTVKTKNKWREDFFRTKENTHGPKKTIQPQYSCSSNRHNTEVEARPVNPTQQPHRQGPLHRSAKHAQSIQPTPPGAVTGTMDCPLAALLADAVFDDFFNKPTAQTTTIWRPMYASAPVLVSQPSLDLVVPVFDGERSTASPSTATAPGQSVPVAVPTVSTFWQLFWGILLRRRRFRHLPRRSRSPTSPTSPTSPPVPAGHDGTTRTLVPVVGNTDPTTEHSTRSSTCNTLRLPPLPALYTDTRPSGQLEDSTWARSPCEEGMHCTALEQQILRQLTDDDTQWDMIKEIKKRGIDDGGLDITEVDGVSLTAVEAEMLAECTDDACGWLMTAAATQRHAPPSVPGLGDASANPVHKTGRSVRVLMRSASLPRAAGNRAADRTIYRRLSVSRFNVHTSRRGPAGLVFDPACADVGDRPLSFVDTTRTLGRHSMSPHRGLSPLYQPPPRWSGDFGGGEYMKLCRDGLVGAWET